MKKLLVVIIIVATSATSLLAQNKGDIFVGGIIGGGISTNFIDDLADTSVANLSADIGVGYFAADKLKIGAEVGYAFSASDGSNMHVITVGPNISYYAKLAEKLYYTPSFTICFALAATEGTTIPGFGLGLNLFGMEFRPTPRLGFTANLASISYVRLSKDGFSAGTLGINVGINPSVGFKYYF